MYRLLFLSLPLFSSLSLSVSISGNLCLSASLSVCFYLCLSASRCLCLPVCPSVRLSLSLCLSLSLSLSPPPSPPLSLPPPLYVHVCVTRTGWKTRPRPKTVILPIKKSNQINQSLSPLSLFSFYYVNNMVWGEGDMAAYDTVQPLFTGVDCTMYQKSSKVQV